MDTMVACRIAGAGPMGVGPVAATGRNQTAIPTHPNGREPMVEANR